MRLNDLVRDSIRDLLSQDRNSGIPADVGIAVSVVSSEDVLFQEGYGLRNRAQSLPVTPQTVFSVSSSTKAFTASSWMMLAEKTGFDLERPVNDTSRIPLSDPEISERYSTLDVLSHRTGLPSNDLLWMLTPFRLEELTRRLRYLEIVPEAFRGQFIYSNLLYAALHEHFRNAAGETWSDFAAPHIGQTELQPRVSIELPVPFIFEGLDWAVGEEASYGLGWFIGRAWGKRVVFHPGFIDGSSACSGGARPGPI
jgi:CubicO group peptidase (beta-lactamase class C family)